MARRDNKCNVATVYGTGVVRLVPYHPTLPVTLPVTLPYFTLPYVTLPYLTLPLHIVTGAGLPPLIEGLSVATVYGTGMVSLGHISLASTGTLIRHIM